MASQYYGKNRGAQVTSITTGASTTGKPMELVVDLASGVTRGDVILYLQELQQYLLNERSTPFAQ